LGTMVPTLSNQGMTSNNTITDSVVVELHETISPYTLVAMVKTILNTNGNVTCNFPPLNGSYYLTIKHRNTIETWSHDPIVFSVGTPISYDFTTNANKAYGLNQREVESGVWAFYSGDITQDENIDLLDLGLLEADISNFIFGYFATDINGDGNIDLLDVSNVENNINSFIFSNHP
jgi:hypothetical protein